MGVSVLRIHFTGDDLARTRVATDPDPMWETLLSAYLLRRTEGEIEFGRWRHESRQHLGHWVRSLFDLVPAAGSAPDFLTPADAGVDIDHGIDVLMHTSRTRVRTDLTSIAKERDLPPWTADLAQGRPQPMRALAHAYQRYFRACLAPRWSQVRAHIDQDTGRRMRTLAHGGVDQLLNTLVPGARWHAPVLELDYPADHEIHLEGRGLLLQPVFFDCGTTGTTLVDPSRSPVLAYPVAHELDWMITPGHSGDPLGALLGRTRARVLRAIVTGDCTTTELSQRISIPLATASRQASILRDAGLVVSQRCHNTVVHAGTALGASLCNGAQPIVRERGPARQP